MALAGIDNYEKTHNKLIHYNNENEYLQNNNNDDY